MSHGLYIYSIIRKDIPLADQIVQTAHSAFHAGNENPRLEWGEIPSLILLQAKDKEELEKLAVKLYENGIHYHLFFEPDDDLGNTSLTTKPISGDQRKLFSNMKLWRP